MNSDDWFNDRRFERFRTYYQHGRQWYQQHQIAYWKAQAQAAIYENQQLHYLLQNVCECNARLEAMPHPPTGMISENEQLDMETSDTNIEMEISDEMLEFFAKSMKHKEERRELEKQTEISYINVNDLPLESRAVDIYGVNIPDQDASNEKLKSYKLLYGLKADRIHAMETAMELSFHRNCDMKQPRLWPNMPLKL